MTERDAMGRFVAKAEIDDASWVSALERMTDSVRNSAQNWNARFELVGKAIDLVTGSVGFLVEKSSEWANAAIEAERNEQALASTLALRGQFTREAFEANLQLVSSMQQETLIADDNILRAQQRLVLMGAENEQLDLATRAAIGLAGAKGNVEAAAQRVGRVIDGDTKVLERYGIHTKDINEALNILADRYDIVVAQADTFGGRVDRLNINLGELDETLGRQITTSGAANVALAKSDELVRKFTGFMEGDDGRRVVDAFFQTLMAGAQIAAETLAILSDTADGLFKRFEFYQGVFEDRGFIGGLVDMFKGEAMVVEPLVEGVNDGASALERLRGLFSGLASDIHTARVEAENAGPVIANPAGGAAGDFADRGGRQAKGPKTETANADDLFLLEKTMFPELANLRVQMTAAQSAYEMKRAFVSEQEQLDLELQVARNDARFEAELAAFDAREKLAAERETKIAKITTEAGSELLGGLIANAGQAMSVALKGQEDFDDALGRLAAGTISSVGQMLFQIGTAAVLASLLGAIPIFAPFVGPPGMGAALGGLVAAGGLGMMALGAALGSGASSGGGGVPSAGGVGGGSRVGGAPAAPNFGELPQRGAFAQPGADIAPNVTIVNFYAPTDRKAAAKELGDLLDERDRGRLRRRKAA